MFLQTFIMTYAITVGIVCAAISCLLVAALIFWVYMNIKERLVPKETQIRRVEEDDGWENKPIGGWGE